jgi:arsenite-transporting ATPase
MNPVQTVSGSECPRAPPRDQPAFLQPGEFSLLLFGGKGGVGKTTCATGTALRLAQRFPGRNYLLASTDPAHSLEDCLAGTARPPNLQVRELDAQKSLRQFKDAHAGHLRLIAQRGTFLDDDDIGKFLDLSLPGLDELMAFIELSVLVEGRGYACIIVDTAPTGHTLRLLGLPDVLRKWLGALDAMLAKHRYLTRLYSGRPRRDDVDLFLEELAAAIEGLAALLIDPHRCRFVPVMLAEPLVTDETARLVHALQCMRVPVQEIVVNCVYPPEPDCLLCQETRQWQAEEMRRIRKTFSDCRLWSVPLQVPEVQGVPQLTVFWDSARSVGWPESPATDVDRDRRNRRNAKRKRAPPRRVPLAACLPVPPEHGWAPSPRVEHPARLPSPETSLLFFAGKGGVGKTTLATATALRLAQEHQDRRILLLSVDPAHSLSDCLGRSIGPRAVRLDEQLSAIEIDAEGEFAELKRQYAEEVEGLCEHVTGSGACCNLAFDREVVERLMDLSPPGLDEVMALTRVIQLLEAGEYDTFVCDTAPTGHLIRLLELPALVQQWLGVFFGLLLKYKRVLRFPRISELLVAMSKRLKVLRALLVDPRKGSFQVVTIPTEMAFAETCDLLAACQQAGIHVPRLFVNLVRPAGNCSLCDALVKREARIHTRLKATFADVTPVVVYRGAPPRGLARLAELGRALYGT